MRVRLPDGKRRRLLLREAARLQSFPDWFNFWGSESSQFYQIGNAVPPLLAKRLARSVREYLESEERLTNDEILKRIPPKQLELPGMLEMQRHARSYSGPPCALCAVVRIMGRLQGEKLVRITRVAGEADEKGHYLHAESIACEPGEAFEPYREKIRRLPLPPLLADSTHAPSAEHPGTATGSALPQMAALRITSWDTLTIDVHADDFRVGEITGYPSDLGLAQHEWSLFCDLARARGKYAPKLLGAAAQQVRDNMERINAALKEVFPQILGEPIKRAGAGGYETAFTVQTGDMPMGKLGW